jgi:hypothetical protein
MILFQSQIAEHQQLAEHYRELAAKREALAQSFIEVQSQAQTDLGSLKALVEKCSSLGGNDAIASLKNAVIALFGSDDDGNDGGNQPTEPTPDTDPDEPELLCLAKIEYRDSDRIVAGVSYRGATYERKQKHGDVWFSRNVGRDDDGNPIYETLIKFAANLTPNSLPSTMVRNFQR